MIFTKVPMKRPPSNTFPLPHSWKASIALKQLYPVTCVEVVPDDTFHWDTAVMTKFAPLVSPVMHECAAFLHFFFVPNRLLWDNWEDFITGGELGTDTPTFPTIDLNDANYAAYPLLDYMGLPDPQGATEPVSALPFGAHTLIWDEYYRDQNLITAPLFTGLTDGDNTANIGDLCRIFTRSWMHDYFTSALPWTQRGPEATIPLGSTATIGRTGGTFDDLTFVGGQAATQIRRVDGTAFGADDITFNAGSLQPIRQTGSESQLDVTDHTRLNLANIQVDLSSATAASINDLRAAFSLQEFLETNARGGSRYTEVIYAHFGVKNPDARLQRPEFIGGARMPVQFSEVLQTSSTDTTSPQANMAGHGIGVGRAKHFRYYAKEHGYIIGYISVMPKTAYFQGIPKHFLKRDKFEFYWKEFAHLGEQPILNKELFVDDDGENDTVFGYTPRYAEYKYIPSTVHGTFRTTEKYWTMVRDFTTRPLLNDQFLENTDGISRIFADTANDTQLWVQVYHQVRARRPMPYFGIPRW